MDEANLKEPEKLPRGDVWQDGGLWEDVPFLFRVNKPDSGKTVTADALHCRRETCRRIMQRKGEYLFGLKENQPSLLEDVRLFFEDPSNQNEWECSETAKIANTGNQRSVFCGCGNDLRGYGTF